nr:MAG TPA: hypothetical protein [Caudoviricetes sp.]
MPDIFSLGNIQMSAKSSDIFNIIITIITKIPNQIIHISYIFNNCLKIWKVYITQRMTKQCNLFQIIQRLKKAQVMIYYVIRMFYVLRIIIFQTLLNMIYSIISYWIFPIPFFHIYNPQIQISAESGTKRSIFRQKNKTKRSKNRLHTTLIKPEQKVNEDLCSGFVLS